MSDTLYFDIERIYTLVHKTEDAGFYYNNPSRLWDGFIILTDGTAVFKRHGCVAADITKGSIVFLRKGEKYSIYSEGGCAYFTSAMDIKENGTLTEYLPYSGICSALQLKKAEQFTEMWQMQLRDSYMFCKTELLRLYLDFIKMNTALFAESEDSTVNRAIKFIHQNFKHNFKSEEIGEFCNISPSHLRAKFLKETGKTITEYRDGLRINAAKELLSSGFYTVKEAAFELGFCDVYYFTKFFTEAVGISPAKYIKKIY